MISSDLKKVIINAFTLVFYFIDNIILMKIDDFMFFLILILVLYENPPKSPDLIFTYSLFLNINLFGLLIKIILFQRKYFKKFAFLYNLKLLHGNV